MCRVVDKRNATAQLHMNSYIKITLMLVRKGKIENSCVNDVKFKIKNIVQYQ